MIQNVQKVCIAVVTAGCRRRENFGPFEELYSMVQNKMATAKLGFEICPLATIPERADVRDGSGGKRETSDTPPKPLWRREGHRAAINGLEGY